MAGNGYTSGVPPQKPGDVVRADNMERLRQADERSLPRHSFNTAVTQTPSGSIVRALPGRRSVLPCCMGYEPWAEWKPEEEDKPEVPPREATFWIGASDNPAHRNYNTGDPKDRKHNRACPVQNFWLRASRDPADGYTEWVDYEGGYWKGNPDKYGQLDLRLNGYDSLFSMLFGHPSSGYYLNYLKEGAFFGSWSTDWVDTDNAGQPIENGAWESDHQYGFLDADWSQSSYPKLEIYKDKTGGDPHSGADYSFGEKCTYYGGELHMETWSDGTNHKANSSFGSQFRQLFSCDTWKSTLILWQGDGWHDGSNSTYQKRGKYISADANYPAFTVYSDNEDNDYNWGYKLDYRAAEFIIETWFGANEPGENDTSSYNCVLFKGYEPSFVIYSGQFDNEGAIGENYFSYKGNEGLLSMGDQNSENFWSVRIDRNNQECSFWMYDQKLNNLKWYWGGLEMWNETSGTYGVINADEDEASFWFNDAPTDQNIKWSGGVLELWHQGSGVYCLLEAQDQGNARLYLSNSEGAWGEWQTSTIFLGDGDEGKATLWPGGLSLSAQGGASGVFQTSTLFLSDGGGGSATLWPTGLTLSDGSGTIDLQCGAVSGKTAYFQSVQLCVDGQSKTAYVLMTAPE